MRIVSIYVSAIIQFDQLRYSVSPYDIAKVNLSVTVDFPWSSSATNYKILLPYDVNTQKKRV